MLFFVEKKDKEYNYFKNRSYYVAGIEDSNNNIILKSDSNTVRLPFESEYGILLN